MEIPWIQLIINILVILITALLTYYFAKQRYTFEKLHDRKLISLEEIYAKIISLEKDLKKYIYTTGSSPDIQSLSTKSSELSIVKDKFFDLQDFFWKKEIIIADASTSIVQSFIDISIETISQLEASIVSQSIHDPATSRGQWQEAYQIMETKLKKSKEQLKEEFKDTVKK